MNIIRVNENISNEKAYLYKSPIGKIFLSADSSNKYLTNLDFNANKKFIKKLYNLGDLLQNYRVFIFQNLKLLININLCLINKNKKCILVFLIL